MDTNQATALNYFYIIEETFDLDSSLWIKYINLSNEITGRNVSARKCRRQLKRAHAYLSDYYKQNGIIK